ncbi:MAG: hypothetical protein HY316_02355 [Acidobacteria bacterium]|nr:hypothetical protein [Acidobacteriota bacterium]
MQILKQKQYLRHAQYGLGVVSESNAERTTIDFELHGVKKFVTELMQFELLAGQAPVRASLTKQKSKKSSGLRSVKSKADPGKA